MILLMFVAVYGCTTDTSPALEQGVNDVVDGEDTNVTDVEILLDDADVVPTVEEDVEN